MRHAVRRHALLDAPEDRARAGCRSPPQGRKERVQRLPMRRVWALPPRVPDRRHPAAPSGGSMTPVEHQRARRATARKLGLCQLCPRRRQRSARPGRSTCEECAKEVLRRQRKRSRRLREAGLCDRCGELPRTDGIWCAGCAKHMRSLPSHGRHVTHERRRQERLCRTGCGRSAFAGTRCKECAREEADAHKARRDERIARGLCYRCGKAPAPAGQGCERCINRRRSRRPKQVPMPIALLRCGACGRPGHKKSARRCPLWKRPVRVVELPQQVQMRRAA